MVRRFILIILLISLLLATLGCKAGGADLSGTWTCTQGSKDYDKGNILELKSDKTLFVYNPGENGVSGTWKIEGEYIYLIFDFAGMTWKGQVKGDTITLEEGSVWMKGKANVANSTGSIPIETNPTSGLVSPKVTQGLAPGKTIIGDFSITLSSVERNEQVATLSFVVEKLTNTSSETVNPININLIDDHNNRYPGTIDIKPVNAPTNLLSTLPVGFTYLTIADVTISKAAPITKIQLGSGGELSYKDVKFAKPIYKTDFNSTSIKGGASVSLGKFITLKFATPEAGSIGWKTPIMVTNTDYNPSNLDIGVGLQFNDGKIIWIKGGNAIQVSGSGQTSIAPQILNLTNAANLGCPKLILFSLFEKAKNVGDLKTMSVTVNDFPLIPERFAFESNGHVFVSKPDGSDKVDIGYGKSPAWSMDGTKLAFISRSNAGQICLSLGDNAISYVKVVPSLDLDYFYDIAWSPDKNRLVLGILRKIYVMNSDGSNLSMITEGDYATWSSDGAKIAYGILGEYQGENTKVTGLDFSNSRFKDNIYTVSPTGTNKTLLTTGRYPSYSPTDSNLAYEKEGNIYIFNEKGSTQLTNSGNAWGPAWSPDGSKVIFCEKNNSSGNLYKINIDGTSKEKIGAATTTAWSSALKLTEKGLVNASSPISSSQPSKPYPALFLDDTSIPALTVGVEATIKGTIKSNGIPAANTKFGIHDGIRQQSYLVTTDSQGRFSFSSTPVEAKPAIVEFLWGDQVFANSVYQVKDKTGNALAWIASEIKFENTTNKPVKLQAESPFGDLLLYTIQPGEIQTVIKTSTPAVENNLPYSFTFKPTIYSGTFGTVGGGLAGDITASATLNNEGVTTLKFKGGVGVIARFSVYSTSELNKGFCWEPGAAGGVLAGAEIGASICLGTDGFSLGGGLGYGVITSGFKIQIIEW
jgi:hypothetical protein